MATIVDLISANTTELGDIHLKHLLYQTKDNNFISQSRTPSVTRMNPSSRVTCFIPTSHGSDDCTVKAVVSGFGLFGSWWLRLLRTVALSWNQSWQVVHTISPKSWDQFCPLVVALVFLNEVNYPLGQWIARVPRDFEWQSMTPRLHATARWETPESSQPRARPQPMSNAQLSSYRGHVFAAWQDTAVPCSSHDHSYTDRE